MIVIMSLCALWGMPPGMAVACGWAPYFCAWSFEPAMNQWYSALSLTPSPLDLAGTQGAQNHRKCFIPLLAMQYPPTISPFEYTEVIQL